MEEEEGITLVQGINLVKDYLVELKKNKLASIVIILLSVVLGIVVSVLSKPVHIASSTIMLESSKGGAMSGAMALASQFGLLSGGSGGSAINEDKLVELIPSESIVKMAMFRKVSIDSVNDFLANHFIEQCGLREEWKTDDSLKEFRFMHPPEFFNLNESRVFKMLYGITTTKYLKVDKSKSGIISVTITSPSESFSKQFDEQLVNATTDFYVNRIIEKSQKNLDLIQERVDSVADALRDSELALARWKDASNQLVKAQGMINEIKLRRNVEVNNSMYIEGIKQLEVSKFSMLNDVPFLQVIDTPSLPLAKKGKISLVKGGVGGFLIGFLLVLLYVWVRKKYREIKIELENTTVNQ